MRCLRFQGASLKIKDCDTQYENDEGGSHSDWFSLTQITSITKYLENKRKKVKGGGGGEGAIKMMN